MPIPVRVLHLITRLIIGGAQENTMYTAAMLNPERFQVEILSGPQTGSEGSLIEEIRQRDIPLTIIPDLVRQINVLKDWGALRSIRRLLEKERYSIVHTHSSKAGILGRLAAKLAGTPIIIHTVHGWSFHDWMNPFIRQMFIFLERQMAAFCDAIIVVSQVDQDKGLRAGISQPEKYHLIRSAIPLELFDPQKINRDEVREALGIPAGAVVIGNVGRFSPQKNPLDWVQAAGKISQACPDAWFLLVGDGPLRSEVEAIINQNGIAGRVILTGLRRDVPQLMAAMDVFMITSLWEGLPRVIPQAMAMKLPVVANRADGTIEAVIDGSTGYLCTPGDIDQIAQRCITLFYDSVKRNEMGELARNLAIQEFDLNQMINQIETLYLALIEERQKLGFSTGTRND